MLLKLTVILVVIHGLMEYATTDESFYKHCKIEYDVPVPNLNIEDAFKACSAKYPFIYRIYYIDYPPYIYRKGNTIRGMWVGERILRIYI